MFSPSLLYDVTSNQKTVIAFHAIAMAHVCKNLNAGIPGGMAATLQMNSISGHDISDTDMPRYLLAKDSYGYQVVMASNLSWKDQWSDIMQAGIGAYPDFSATGFLALARIANAVYTDLITRVTLTDNLFLVGQGPYAYVATLLAKKLIVHQNRVRQVYIVSGPRSLTNEVWNQVEALDVPHTHVRGQGDQTSDCPPSQLSFDGFGRGFLTFAQGRNTVLPELSRFGTVYHINAGMTAQDDQTRGWPNLAATLHLTDPLHWHDDVSALAVAQGATDTYINGMWATLTRDFHARLNDWRGLLNSNYGFALRSLQNLGI